MFGWVWLSARVRSFSHKHWHFLQCVLLLVSYHHHYYYYLIRYVFPAPLLMFHSIFWESVCVEGTVPWFYQSFTQNAFVSAAFFIVFANFNISKIHIFICCHKYFLCVMLYRWCCWRVSVFAVWYVNKYVGILCVSTHFLWNDPVGGLWKLQHVSILMLVFVFVLR